MIIDAHLHLWKKQKGFLNGKPVYDVGGGKSNFGGEIRQMMPPYIVDGENSADKLIANMDYGCVNGGVAVQEYIDGNQDEYLLSVKKEYGKRIKITCLYEDYAEFDNSKIALFDGVKICAGRLENQDLKVLLPLFKQVEKEDKFIAIDLSDGDSQVADMEYLIENCPDLRIAIGHFGMVGRDGWKKQIGLATYKNVFIESGGITWLFNYEFYPYPSAIDAIIEAKKICGIDKLMWGSDYPRTMTAITYNMSFDFILKSNKLTDKEKDKFLGKNAISFYRFEDLVTLEKIKSMVED